MQLARTPESFMSFFASTGGQNYMMRSEKRPGRYGSPKKRGRRPRRRHILYGVFTMIVSVLLWPAGMIMLWVRRLRWGFSVKCLVSLVTLVAFCGWIYAGLTMPTEDVTFQKIQTGAQTALTKGMDAIVDAGDVIANTSTDVWIDIADFNSGIAAYSKELIAAGIEYSADFAAEAQTVIADSVDAIAVRVSSLFASSDEVPGATVAPSQSPLPSPAAAPSVHPEVVPSAQPRVTVSAPATVLPSVTPAASPESSDTAIETLKPTAASAASSATPRTVQTTASAKPTVVASASINPTATAKATVKPTVSPSATPASSPKPTMVPSPSSVPGSTELLAIDPDTTPLPTLKPVGDAIVYHTTSGKSYHMSESCIGMSGAKPYTLAESVANGFGSCGNCFPPKPAILKQENVFWCDEENVFHTSDECSSFTGVWSLITLEDAMEQENIACTECGAAGYAGNDVPAATVAPTLVIEPSVTLKPASEATVYHSTNGSWYHSRENCQSMRGADPDSLGNSLALNLKWCRRCEPPKPELLDADVLWTDGSGVAHTSDACSAFSGKCSLILLEDATGSDLIACPVCCANEYLPGAVIADTTAEPAVTSAASADPEPVDEAALRKLAGETAVYYSSISKYYHKNRTCVGMSSSSAHTLAEALDAGLKRCGACNPPTLDDLRSAD